MVLSTDNEDWYTRISKIQSGKKKHKNIIKNIVEGTLEGKHTSGRSRPRSVYLDPLPDIG